MTDNRLAEATDIVARRLLAEEWDGAPDDIYLDDLELSDEDARAVVARVQGLVDDLNPTDEQHEAATEFLAERADDEDDGEEGD